MHIRKYRPGEEETLWRLFFETVRTVNRRDYDDEQVRAWARDDVDAEKWRERMAHNEPFVCEQEGQIIGFADVQPSGYIDQFYVHHAWQRRGVGRRLMDAIDAEAARRRLTQLTSDVSITARPFFESRGFEVVRRQEVVRGAVVLNNYKMIKRLTLGRLSEQER